jgi:glycosyltransferase involved in cell wall biosynthesis
VSAQSAEVSAPPTNSEGSDQVTVLLCTYNGASHLRAQLQSIFEQTLTPAEIVVSDDGSSDGTLEIIREAVSEFNAELELPVKIVQTVTSASGIVANVQHAMRHVTMPLVAFADQDDVWFPNRLRLTVDLLNETGGAVVGANAMLVREDLSTLDLSARDRLMLSRRDRRQLAADRPLPVLLRGNIVPGMTITASSAFVRSCLPVPDGWIHDYWLCLAAAVGGQLTLSETPVVLYRQHADNQLGIGLPSAPVGTPRWLEVLREKRTRYEDLRTIPGGRRKEPAVWGDPEVVGRLCAETDCAATQNLLRSKARFAQGRASVPQTGAAARIAFVLSNLLGGNYSRFVRTGASAALGDLITTRRTLAQGEGS